MRAVQWAWDVVCHLSDVQGPLRQVGGTSQQPCGKEQGGGDPEEVLVVLTRR